MVDEKIYISQIPKLMDEWDWNKNNKIGIISEQIVIDTVNKKSLVEV